MTWCGDSRMVPWTSAPEQGAGYAPHGRSSSKYANLLSFCLGRSAILQAPQLPSATAEIPPTQMYTPICGPCDGWSRCRGRRPQPHLISASRRRNRPYSRASYQEHLHTNLTRGVPAGLANTGVGRGDRHVGGHGTQPRNGTARNSASYKATDRHCFPGATAPHPLRMALAKSCNRAATSPLERCAPHPIGIDEPHPPLP